MNEGRTGWNVIGRSRSPQSRPTTEKAWSPLVFRRWVWGSTLKDTLLLFEVYVSSCESVSEYNLGPFHGQLYKHVATPYTESNI